MSDARGKLAVKLDGEPMAEADARAFWERFSAHMEANKGDLAGFAKAEGLASVHPSMEGGRPVLIVASRSRPRTPYTNGPMLSVKRRDPCRGARRVVDLRAIREAAAARSPIQTARKTTVSPRNVGHVGARCGVQAGRERLQPGSRARGRASSPDSRAAPAHAKQEGRWRIAYTAHTEACTYLLDAEGICRSVLAASSGPEARGGPVRIPVAAERCIGAQYVASLDLRQPGGMIAAPTPGAQLLFARTEKNGRITLVRTAPSAPLRHASGMAAAVESGVHARPSAPLRTATNR